MKALILTTLLVFCGSAAAAAPVSDWWDMDYPVRFDKAQLKPQPAIRVEKNRFVSEEDGSTFVFRGMSIADPDKLAKHKQWEESLFTELATNWGVNAIRLPIHPIAWQQRGKEAYLELLDQAVVWANRAGIYLIIDWHSIGYLPTEQFQHVMYDTTLKETRDFWRTVAFRYKDIPAVSVYELFNEPTDGGGTFGKFDWKEWKSLNEDLIDMIRAENPTAIPLVAGYNWAYDLTPVKRDPINRSGIAYAVHPYPQKAKPDVPSKENFFALWEKSWGFVAKKYPMIATELGWVQADGRGAHIPVINDGSYGPQIMEFMNARGISWIGWVFERDWYPAMIEDWDKFTPSEQGAFFKKALLDAKR